MFRTQIKWLAFAFLALGFSTQSGSARPLTPAEETVCRNVRHCLDILKNHDAESFDYQVLKDEFIEFGQTGKERLLKAMSDANSDLSRNAVIMLSLSSYEFSAADIKTIANQWPRGDVEALANLMLGEYSPPIRQAAITTLTNQAKDIASWSRKILHSGEMDADLGLVSISDFTPSPADFDLLRAAAVENPTQEIAQFLAKYPAEDAQPILRDLLSDESSTVVLAALNGLYVYNRERSFKSLRKSVSLLKSGEENIALAIADAVRGQYRDTQDKEFIVFANRLLTDTSSSEFEAMVGADILMGLGSEEKLPEREIALTGLEKALSAHDTVPLFYMDGLKMKFGANLEAGLKISWTALDKRVSPNKSEFLDALYRVPKNETSLEIFQSALENRSDWRVVEKAAEIVSAKKLFSFKPALREVAETHPVLNAKAAAMAALDSLSGDQTDYSKLRKAWEQKIASEAKWCTVKPIDFKSGSSQLPFFNAAPIAYSRMSDRASLSSALSTGGGWLAGYDQGEFSGGLVYYDNRTGTGELIYGQASPDESYKEYYVPNVVGIAPKVQRPLGQYGKDYWAFSGLNHFGSVGTILSIKVQGEDIDVQKHFQLPRAPKAISQLEDNSLLIGFGEKPKSGKAPDFIPGISHPPLRLLPDGAVVSGCLKLPKFKTQVTP